ncbi:MAG: hypothetical protein ABF651_03985 [Sporolactobacillus sp.]
MDLIINGLNALFYDPSWTAVFIILEISIQMIRFTWMKTTSEQPLYHPYPYLQQIIDSPVNYPCLIFVQSLRIWLFRGGLHRQQGPSNDTDHHHFPQTSLKFSIYR